MKAKLNSYRVHVGYRSSIIVRKVKNSKEAKEIAWDDIKDGYRYGWRSKSQFMKKVQVEKL